MITLKEITDVPDLMRWRTEVIQHVFDCKPDEGLLSSNRRYYETHIADGSHFAFVAECDGDEVGCGAICLSDELPSPDNRSGKCAYLMNIYVREAFRNKGIANQIVKRLLKKAAGLGCGKIYLETTDAGRNLYTSLGFKDMPDMMKYYGNEI